MRCDQSFRFLVGTSTHQLADNCFYLECVGRFIVHFFFRQHVEGFLAVNKSTRTSGTKDVFPTEDVQSQRLKQVDRESLQQQSYQTLRDALMKGRFMPGDTVSLRNLASELGTSPMPVREAVQHLIAEGALVLRPNRTYAVPEMTREILAELLKLRTILEGAIAEAAALSISKEDLSVLYELQGEMRAALAVGDSKRYLMKNQDFHFTIYRCSGMGIAVNVIENLWLRIGPSFNLLTSGPRAAQRTAAEIAALTAHHEAALSAIVARAPAALRAAIEHDIGEGMNFIISCMPE
ncbi:GntR family transcriptional regulator [Pannonibacter sp. Pt2]|uniref:GntR family transcriptional regulator n=1 Tax=Pannonibacter anstelovis TaxID=3121537 RepID=A0ABU7ZRR2_9HYPH